jgi:hypothetical protein
MGFKSKDNLSLVVSSIGKNNYSSPKSKQVGKVYGIVTTEDTPTPTMFKKAGGYDGMGSVFYLDYDQSKNVTGSIDDNFLDNCIIAKPLYPSIKYYPLIGELIVVEDKLPSPFSQVSPSSDQKYYTVLNLWNNPQLNTQPSSDKDSPGSTFYVNPNIRPLVPYQGDYIIEGRQGSTLRFSTTTRINPQNEWSQIGNEVDSIAILTNGLAYNPNQKYYVEQINADSSSIYLTSTQKIPLQTDKTGILNNLTNPLNVPDYFNSQVILNSDRVTINSKKDEVMIFATTNVEINTKNVINLNADTRVHLNSNSVFLGPYNNNNIPQPVLLGNETINLLIHLQQTLTRLSGYLTSAVSAPVGAPIVGLNAAGKDLVNDMKKMIDLIDKVPSQKVFTV